MIKEKAKYFFLFPYLLVLYEITNYLANDMYLPALPLIALDLNTTTYLAQQTLTTFFLGAMSLQLFLGPLSDRMGRRPILLGSGVVFIISSMVCALTSKIEILLIARFFQGCSICAIAPAGYASIHELFEQTKAIQILAIMASITVLAPAFGPLLGGIVLLGLNWRWIFGLLVIWAAVALILLWFVMPETNPKEKRHPFAWQTLLTHYAKIISNPKFMLNTLVFCLTFLGMIAWIAAGPFLVINTFKSSALYFGLLQALIFSCLIIGSQVVKYTIDRLGPLRLINIGLLIVLIGGISALGLTFLFPHFLFGLVLSLMIFTFGSSMAFSPSQRVAIEASPEPMGARMAILSTLMSLFGAIGGILVSFTYTGTLFWFGSLLFIIAVLACLTQWILVCWVID